MLEINRNMTIDNLKFTRNVREHIHMARKQVVKGKRSELQRHCFAIRLPSFVAVVKSPKAYKSKYCHEIELCKNIMVYNVFDSLKSQAQCLRSSENTSK